MTDSRSLQSKCATANPPNNSRKPDQSGYASSQSSFESVSSGFLTPPRKDVQIVDFRKATSLLQEPSSITGENLLDHLTDIIKRIIDERPTNVVDYFEQFSRDVRRHKFRFAEGSSRADPYKEPQFLELAEAVIKPLKLPETIEDFQDVEYVEEDQEFVGESEMTLYQFSDSSIVEIQRDLESNENVLQLQHFWAFCGLGFQVDEMFQLAWAVQKIQCHQTVKNARFWGRIYGLKGSYYIVEATLTKTENHIRSKTMKSGLVNDMIALINRRDQSTSFTEIDANLIAGSSWQHYSKDELQRMQHQAAPIPQLRIEEKFEMPAELAGSGLNRKTYFVTTCLSDEWQELPIVTPRQIKASKTIKKYFTGNLETKLASFPLFPGTEKNYLRAIIARITSGVYIAPKGYYRTLTKKEKLLAAGNIAEEEDDVEGDYAIENEEDEDLYNDSVITENTYYKPFPLKELTCPSNWVHLRPNILNQGRVIYIDEELAVKDLEKKALLKLKGIEIHDQEVREEFDIEEDEAEDEELLDEEQRPAPEIGPQLFASCSDDTNKCNVPPWTSRYSSVYDKTSQMILMRSNLWPGAYTVASEKFSDSIYLGWGFKYVSRCTSLENLPKIEDFNCADVTNEITDPSVAMEEKWRLCHLAKDTALVANEEMSDISVEYDVDDEEDED